MRKILISPEGGAGWYTWNRDTPECLSHPDIIKLVETKASTYDIVNKADELWPYGYWDAGHHLKIQLLEEGTLFRITEDYGYETLKTPTDYDWLTAWRSITSTV